MLSAVMEVGQGASWLLRVWKLEWGWNLSMSVSALSVFFGESDLEVVGRRAHREATS